MWLGLATLFVGPVLGTSAAVLVPFAVRTAGNAAGDALGITVAVGCFALTVAAVAAAVRAFRSGERSWVMWVGFVPAMLAVLFWAALVVGELAVPH